MEIKEAIKKIAKGDSLIALIAEMALESQEEIDGFAQFITDQFDNGSAPQLAAEHGFDVIDTIITYYREKNQ